MGTGASKEWWKYATAGKDAPAVQSRVLLKQNQKYWAVNDAMLLADNLEVAGPADFFKQTHVPKAGEKLVPDKPSNIVHCTDEALLGVAQVQRGHKAQSKWSKDFKEFECLGEDRLLDKTVKAAAAREQAEIDRQAKLVEYFKQPQRGSRGRTHDEFATP